MFWAVIGTFISRFANIFYSKVTKYNKPANLNELFSYFGGFSVIIIFILLGKFSLLFNSIEDYLLLAVCIFISCIQMFFSNNVYKKEKISAIVPFSNIGKIIAVFLGVLVLGEKISTLALILFSFTFIILIGSTLDIKNMRFSMHILLYIFSKFLGAIKDLSIGYILISNTPFAYYSIYILLLFLIILIINLVKGHTKMIKELDKKYYFYTTLSSLGYFSTLINLILIKEKGLSITIMLSFLGVGISLIMSYIVFKDILSKKNIIVTLLVTCLVLLGFYTS